MDGGRVKPFIKDDFLLQNNFAARLYHKYASQLPLIDYHSHLPPDEVAGDIQFGNLTRVWLSDDHYKWRAMRTCGVPEELITGDASDREKFQAWAETVPKTIGNPLFHWTHLELKRFFRIDTLLNGDTAEEIWQECSRQLASAEFSARELLKRHKVEVVATTDDPAIELKSHQQLKSEKLDMEVVPTFRPDAGMGVEQGDLFRKWVSTLEATTGISITHYRDFLQALRQRHDEFDRLGCRASDHSIYRPYADPFSDDELEQIFSDAMTGKSLAEEKVRSFKSAFLYHCARMNHEKEWVFQLHIGPLRNTRTRLFNSAGRDAGADSIGDADIAEPLARMLDRLDREESLPRVILYNINPRDNELFVSMAGNFQGDQIPGKVQHGPPWWFMDQKNGIEQHLESLTSLGILYTFVGMTTDSRSFLSWPRHEYFRRILCNWLGQELERGTIPDDPELMKDLIERVCYRNACDFFRFKNVGLDKT